VNIMDALSTFSEALARVIEAGGASVVRVDARRRRPASGTVWAPDGIIITAQHVIESDDDVSVGLPDGRTVAAALVGRDRTTDVAVLRAQAGGLTPPSWATADSLRVGNVLMALGRPGQTVRAALGIVGAAGAQWETPRGGQIDRYVQADIRMWPGFSGGMFVDTQGKALGLATAGVLPGVPLAVPASTLTRVVDTLLTHGRVRRAYLGVGTHPVRLPAGLEQQVGQDGGLLVVSVEPGSPAERGGLLLGDTMASMDGRPLRRLRDLVSLLNADRIGQNVPLRIVRGGRVQDLAVVPGDRVA
jgi:S1-C subfamily serine protease